MDPFENSMQNKSGGLHGYTSTSRARWNIYVFGEICFASWIMNFSNRTKPLSTRNLSTFTPNTTKWFFRVIILMLKRQTKLTWKHSLGTLLPTHRSHQTWTLGIITFDQWPMAGLSNTSLMRLLKIWSPQNVKHRRRYLWATRSTS